MEWGLIAGFLAVLGLHYYAWTFSGCSKWGLPFVAMCGFSSCWLLLLRAWVLGHAGFSSCGSKALKHKLRSSGDGLSWIHTLIYLLSKLKWLHCVWHYSKAKEGVWHMTILHHKSLPRPPQNTWILWKSYSRENKEKKLGQIFGSGDNKKPDLWKFCDASLFSQFLNRIITYHLTFPLGGLKYISD